MSQARMQKLELDFEELHHVPKGKMCLTFADKVLCILTHFHILGKTQQSLAER